MKFIKHKAAKQGTTAKPLDIDAAKKLLDTSAEKNRNLLIAFMAYLATATILALSITDLDLLVDQKTIQLPLLSVGLPMWAFYTVIPLILLLLHFDVLQNVQEHNKKLDAWLAYKPVDAGSQLFPYILDFARVRYGLEATPSMASKLVAAGAWLMYVYLPLMVLAVFFIRFADLQGVATSVYHLGLGIVDFVFICYFWDNLRSKTQTMLTSARWFVGVGFLLQTGAVVWVSFLWLVIQALHFLPYESAPVGLNQAVNAAIGFESKVKYFGDGIALVPRITAPNAQPYQVKDDDIRLAKWLNPTAKEQDLWEQSPRPLDWRGRRLAFADLSAARLQRAILDGVDLQNASLISAKLTGASIMYAKLYRADLRGIDLQTANLYQSELQSANLTQSLFQGAHLVQAIFQDANLHKAKLIGANLTLSQLQGANLDRAELLGSYLIGAQLQGASLIGAQLQATNFRDSYLQGANLQGARISGANFHRAHVKGVFWPDLSKTDFLAIELDTQTTYAFDNSSQIQYSDENIGVVDISLPKLKNQIADRVNRGDGQLAENIDGKRKSYINAWLETLCVDKPSTHMMLIYGSFELPDSDPSHIQKTIQSYLAKTGRCAPYRAMAAEILMNSK